jgi:hypothetical protein
VWIGAGVTDMLKGMDGLAVLVQMALCKGVTVPAGEKGALKNLFAKSPFAQPTILKQRMSRR